MNDYFKNLKPPAPPKYKCGQEVGAFRVVEYLGHMIPEGSGGFIKAHCYTLECLVCQSRHPATQKMVGDRIRSAETRSKKKLKNVSEMGCVKCRGAKPGA